MYLCLMNILLFLCLSTFVYILYLIGRIISQVLKNIQFMSWFCCVSLKKILVKFHLLFYLFDDVICFERIKTKKLTNIVHNQFSLPEIRSSKFFVQQFIFFENQNGKTTMYRFKYKYCVLMELTLTIEKEMKKKNLK